MRRPAEADIGALIERLTADGIEFIVIGGAAVFLHGAPLPTRDLDIVPEPSETNLRRLASTLAELDAIVREPGDRSLRPTLTLLQTSRQLLLRTKLGPCDVLAQLHDGSDHAALLPASIVMTGGSVSVRLLDLPKLIEIKSTTGRAKDRLAVPILLELLRQREE